MRRKSRLGEQRGVALVELALVLPVIVSLLLGTVTGGFALAVKNSMTNAVREAARLGATLPRPAAPDDWNDWAESVRERAVNLAGGDLTNAQVCVEMLEKDTVGAVSVLGSWPAGSPGCPHGSGPVVPANTPNGTCVVRVWAQRTASLAAFFFSANLTLRAPAIARYERPQECPGPPVP